MNVREAHFCVVCGRAATRPHWTASPASVTHFTFFLSLNYKSLHFQHYFNLHLKCRRLVYPTKTRIDNC